MPLGPGPGARRPPHPYLAEEIDAPDLIGPFEIRQSLGVSKARFYQLRHQSGFPPPGLSIQMGDLWWRQDVEDWIAVTAEQRALSQRRTGTYPKHVVQEVET